MPRMSLAEAADHAVSPLECHRDAGLALHPETVLFAALLVRLEGDPIIEVFRQSHGLAWLGRNEVKAHLLL